VDGTGFALAYRLSTPGAIVQATQHVSNLVSSVADRSKTQDEDICGGQDLSNHDPHLDVRGLPVGRFREFFYQPRVAGHERYGPAMQAATRSTIVAR